MSCTGRAKGRVRYIVHTHILLWVRTQSRFTAEKSARTTRRFTARKKCVQNIVVHFFDRKKLAMHTKHARAGEGFMNRYSPGENSAPRLNAFIAVIRTSGCLARRWISARDMSLFSTPDGDAGTMRHTQVSAVKITAAKSLVQFPRRRCQCLDLI